MTRTEHVAWCKKRALEYFNQGDLQNAVASMASDMRKHDECQYPALLDHLAMMALINGDRGEVKRWIDGFS